MWLISYSPLSRIAKAGSWGKKLKQRPWRHDAYWLALLAHAHLDFLEMASLAADWAFLHQLAIKKLIQTNMVEATLPIEVPSSRCIKLY